LDDYKTNTRERILAEDIAALVENSK